MRPRLLLAMVMLAVLFIAERPVRGQQLQMPPDVAEIMKRLKSGGTPSAADLQRIQQWQQQLLGHLNLPGAGNNGSQFNGPASQQQGAPIGIPAKCEATIDYTATHPGSRKHVQMSVWGNARLYASIHGKGDYSANMLNPSAAVSSFRFEPDAPGGKPSLIGGGSYEMTWQDPTDSGATRLTLTKGSCSMLLATTGGDLLFPTGAGGVGGSGDGTHTLNSRTTAVHDEAASANEVLSVPFVAEANLHAQGGKPTPKPTMQLAYDAMVAAVNATGSVAISGEESFDFIAVGGDHVVGKSSLRITLRPTTLDLRVEPADPSVYEKWLPLPDADDAGSPYGEKLFGRPTPIEVHVAIVDPSKPGARPDRAGRIDVTLRDVSKLKGTAMNYPSEDAQLGDPKPDLFFPQKQPAGIEYVDETHVRTTSTSAIEATVRVAARDTGAYGGVYATCESLNLTSHDARGKPTLALPKDDDDNHLADAWEKDTGAKDTGLDASSDVEDEPTGWHSKGDGFTAFEESRGFVVEGPDGKEQFVRLSPKKRELFVFPAGYDKDLYEAGAKRFAAAAGIDVLFLRASFRMGHEGVRPHDNWVNFNKTPWSPKVQRAVWIVDELDSVPTEKASENQGPGPGATPALPGVDAEKTYLSPANIQFVNVSHWECETQIREKWQNWLPPVASHPPQVLIETAQKYGFDLVAISRFLAQARSIPTLVDEFIVYNVVHELGHAIGARHHGLDAYLKWYMTPHNADENNERQGMAYSSGDPACPMRYWNRGRDKHDFLLFLGGQWDLTTGPDKSPWHFCDVNRAELRLTEP